MKLKRILGGVLAAALVVSSLPTVGLKGAVAAAAGTGQVDPDENLAETPLTTVSPKVHRPMSGKNAAAVEKEVGAHYTVKSTKWTWNEGDTSQTFEIGSTFENGKKYKVAAVLEPAEGYVFADGMSAWLADADKENAKYNAEVAPDEEGKVTVSYEFEAFDEDLTFSKSMLELTVQSCDELVEEEDLYTSSTWAAYKKAKEEAQKMMSSDYANEDANTIEAAYEDLGGAVGALKYRVTMPTELTVDGPQYNGVQPQVKMTGAKGITGTTIWYKKDGDGNGSQMAKDAKFEAGNYYVVMALKPDEGYAFEDITKPVSIVVNDGTKNETKTVTATLDEATGAVTFTCEFVVTESQADCTCKINKVTMKIDGMDTGVIYLDLRSSKTVELTVEVDMAECKAHSDRTATYTIVKKEGDVISEPVLENGKYTMNVTAKDSDSKGGEWTATVTVTAKIGDDNKTEVTKDVTFKVTKEDSSLYKDLLDLSAKDTGMSTENLSDFIQDAEKNYLGENTKKNHTDKTLEVLQDAIKQAQDVVKKGDSATFGDVMNVELFLGDVEKAATQEQELANMNAEVKKLAEDEYTEESWSAFQSALSKAKSDVEKLQESWTTENSQLTVEEYANQMESLMGTLSAAKSRLVKKGATPSEDPDLTAAKKAVSDALAAAKVTYDAGKQDGQTDDAWNAFKAAYEAAQNAAADATAAQLNKLADDLTKAQAALKNNTPVNPPADPEIEKAEKALQEKLAEMERVMEAGQLGYSDETWDAFRKAYQDAKNHGSNLTAQQLTDLLNSLCETQEALAAGPELKKAQEDLAKLLEEAKKTKDAGKGTCPDAVWSQFEEAYDAAAKGKDNVDTDAVTKLCSELNTALANMKKAQTVNPGAQQPTGDNLPKAGTQYTVGKLVYQVKTSSVTDKTVMVVKPVKKTNKKLTIPATVTIGGQAYKVVEIKANAFTKNKKLSAVTIGKNVTKIGKKAFLGCAKLKKVTIKAAGLKTIGKQAFAKINKKAKIKVPKKQLKTLKKKLKKAKTIKSAKITK